MMNMNQAVRMDPPGCACTDCLTGYFVPITQAIGRDFDRVISGGMTDATGLSDRDFDLYALDPINL